MTLEIWTIGHSTRSLSGFLDALTANRIEILADVRRFPHSRRQPHFNTDELKRELFPRGIRYEWLGDELGGFRKPRKDSPHVGLRNSSFQGYADHTGTLMFEKGVRRLLELASGARVAYMCSERSPKSCHRKILSDVLAARGHEVRHILDADLVEDHEISSLARRVGDRLVYAPQPLEDFSGTDAQAGV